MTPATISRALADYLTDWLAWVDRGAPDGEPFSRNIGLCNQATDGLLAELWTIFDDVTHPFGGVELYCWERNQGTQHLNEARLAWVRSTLATAEITE